jgi:hypothetical protein
MITMASDWRWSQLRKVLTMAKDTMISKAEFDALMAKETARLQAELDAAKTALASLEAQVTRTVGMAIAPKGGVMITGIRRIPFTLYHNEYLSLDKVWKALGEFYESNSEILSDKGDDESTMLAKARVRHEKLKLLPKYSETGKNPLVLGHCIPDNKHSLAVQRQNVR